MTIKFLTLLVYESATEGSRKLLVRVPVVKTGKPLTRNVNWQSKEPPKGVEPLTRRLRSDCSAN